MTELLSDPDMTDVFTVRRTTESVNSDGNWQTTDSQFTVRGSVQALTPRELERLPEADRDKEHVSVWTAEIMLRAGGEDGDKPDAILYRGREYIVVSVEDWHYLGTAFCKATAMKERA